MRKSFVWEGIPIIELFTVGTGRDLSLQNHRTPNEGLFQQLHLGGFDFLQ